MKVALCYMFKTSGVNTVWPKKHWKVRWKSGFFQNVTFVLVTTAIISLYNRPKLMK